MKSLSIASKESEVVQINRDKVECKKLYLLPQNYDLTYSIGIRL